MIILAFLPTFLLFCGCVVMGTLGCCGSFDYSRNSFMLDFTYNLPEGAWIAMAVIGCVGATIFGFCLAGIAMWAYENDAGFFDMPICLFIIFVVPLLYVGLFFGGVLPSGVISEKKQINVIVQKGDKYVILKDKRVRSFLQNFRAKAPELLWENSENFLLDQLSLENKSTSRVSYTFTSDNKIIIKQSIKGDRFFNPTVPSTSNNNESSNSKLVFFPLPIVIPSESAGPEKPASNTFVIFERIITIPYTGDFEIIEKDITAETKWSCNTLGFDKYVTKCITEQIYNNGLWNDPRNKFQILSNSSELYKSNLDKIKNFAVSYFSSKQTAPVSVVQSQLYLNQERGLL